MTMQASATLSLTVNGEPRSLALPPRRSLADMLRDDLDLTGTHLGCEHGVCGACTVLVDGQPARSCITLAVSCTGAEITTIEGLADDEITSALRAAFTRHHALQCGYCTPGMMVSARDLVVRLPDADERAVRVGLSGNLCRCTGYVGIVGAIMEVIDARRAAGIPALRGGGRTVLGPVGAHSESAIDRSVEPLAPAPHPHLIDAAQVPPAPANMPGGSFEPAARFNHVFRVDQPADRVFAQFADINVVAACIPGVSLTSATGDAAQGSLAVALGPMTMRFEGEARISRNEAGRTGRIEAHATDRSSRSATTGVVDYSVKPVDAANCIVEIAAGYTLRGPLAQFGRSGIVEDVAKRVIGSFAANLERRLAGKDIASQNSLGRTRSVADADIDAGPASTRLPVLSIAIHVLLGRLLRLFGRR